MNYKESKKILEEIKKAKKILVNCHRGPDPDSIGSALAMKGVLKKLKKEGKLEIAEPSEDIKKSYIAKSESNLESAKILTRATDVFLLPTPSKYFFVLFFSAIFILK